jgi:hypothetical protein
MDTRFVVAVERGMFHVEHGALIGKRRDKYGGLSTARQTMGLSVASVEMTFFSLVCFPWNTVLDFSARGWDPGEMRGRLGLEAGILG